MPVNQTRIWVSIARVVAYFPQASLSLPAATAANLETPCQCVCARPSDPHKQSERVAPRAWPLILPSVPSMTFWNSLRRHCKMTGRGTLPPDQWVVKVLSPLKSQHKLCGVWILFKSVTDAKFEPSEVTFLRLMPHTEQLICHVIGSFWDRFWQADLCFAVSFWGAGKTPVVYLGSKIFLSRTQLLPTS